MSYKKVDNIDIIFFKDILGNKLVFSDAESIHNYSHDETEDLIFLPEIVLKPTSPLQIAKIMAYCNKNLICITPIGGKTGLSGGSLPINGGIALSMENFNSIINIDEDNFQAVVEPGVITQVFQENVKKYGFILSTRSF